MLLPLLLLLLLPSAGDARRRKGWTPRADAPELPDGADAAALAADGDRALRALNFSAATALFRMSAAAAASPASVDAFPALVAAGVGLRKCGEVQLAVKMLRYALEGKRGKGTEEAERALAAATGSLAMAVAWDWSRSTEDRVEAITSAAGGRTPPDFRWTLWATNSLKFQLHDDAAALAVLEKGVLAAPEGALELELPATMQKLTWLVRRLRKAKRASALERRLAQEDPLWESEMAGNME